MATNDAHSQSPEAGPTLPARQPKYRRIVESLRNSILSGQYRNGARLPSEAELVRRFGVSRMTAVKAMQQLQQEGLLVRRTGSGTYAAGGVGTQNPAFGLIIPDLGETEIFEPICKGMARSPDAQGHSLSWGHSRTSSVSKEDEAEHLCRQYIEQQVAGVFFAPLEFSGRRDQVNHRILKALSAARIPVIPRPTPRRPWISASPATGRRSMRTGCL
jgi:GntR family transcriptional regulator of arabinose operon